MIEIQNTCKIGILLYELTRFGCIVNLTTTLHIIIVPANTQNRNSQPLMVNRNRDIYTTDKPKKKIIEMMR